MIGSTNKHKMSRHDRTGATSMGGGYGRVEAPCAHQFQFRSSRPTARLLYLPIRANCQGFGLGFSIPRCAPVSLAVMRLRRSVRGCSLPATEPIATNFCGAYSGVRTLLNFGHHVCQDFADVPECHSVRRLSWVVAYAATKPREVSHSAEKTPQGYGNAV